MSTQSPGGPDADMDGFYRVADRYLDAANGLLSTETAARTGAAFMYGCARSVVPVMIVALI